MTAVLLVIVIIQFASIRCIILRFRILPVLLLLKFPCDFSLFFYFILYISMFDLKTSHSTSIDNDRQPDINATLKNCSRATYWKMSKTCWFIINSKYRSINHSISFKTNNCIFSWKILEVINIAGVNEKITFSVFVCVNYNLWLVISSLRRNPTAIKYAK